MKLEPIDKEKPEGHRKVETVKSGWTIIQTVLPNKHIEIKLLKPRPNAK